MKLNKKKSGVGEVGKVGEVGEVGGVNRNR